jgi:hypothetical protein
MEQSDFTTTSFGRLGCRPRKLFAARSVSRSRPAIDQADHRVRLQRLGFVLSRVDVHELTDSSLSNCVGRR